MAKVIKIKVKSLFIDISMYLALTLSYTVYTLFTFLNCKKQK